MKTRIIISLKDITLFMAIFIVIMLFITSITNAQVLLRHPQKIVIDAKRNRLLVSNDNNIGPIVQIDSMGVQTYFKEKGGFIDGMEIVGDTIYGVCKNRKIRAYNLATGDSLFEITFPGLPDEYLSSITSDSAGHLFISCPETNEIYKMRISDHVYWTFAKDSELNRPNGILLERDKNRIVVIDDSEGYSLIHAISLIDSTVTTLDSTTFNSPDGIVRDKYGVYYVGGFYLPGLYRIDANFANPPELVFRGANMVYPTYDIKDHSLLITYYTANKWARIDIATIGINEKKPISELTFFSCFPNPFKNATTIKFELKQKTQTQVEVLDINGKFIVELLNEEKYPGNYSLEWNGKDSSQNKLAEGMYYVTLTINGKMQTQKVILQK